MKLRAGLLGGWMVGLIAGCGGGTRIDAPYPQVSRTRHGLAIQREVGKTALTECPIASLGAATRRQLTPIQARITLFIPPEYQFVQPLALHQARWLDGHHDWAWSFA